MTFIKSEVEWLREHASRDIDGAWWCKKTGDPINVANVGRSIHFANFGLAGSGEVRTVTHLACAGCEPDKKPPRHGEPIKDDDLTEQI